MAPDGMWYRCTVASFVPPDGAYIAGGDEDDEPDEDEADDGPLASAENIAAVERLTELYCQRRRYEALDWDHPLRAWGLGLIDDMLTEMADEAAAECE